MLPLNNNTLLHNTNSGQGPLGAQCTTIMHYYVCAVCVCVYVKQQLFNITTCVFTHTHTHMCASMLI